MNSINNTFTFTADIYAGPNESGAIKINNINTSTSLTNLMKEYNFSPIQEGRIGLENAYIDIRNVHLRQSDDKEFFVHLFNGKTEINKLKEIDAIDFAINSINEGNLILTDPNGQTIPWTEEN
ncbi:MAG: hypothetical protein LBE13_00385 [Bacteroidales bacterium]|nr:hypothetical protein [Bacteroidales bacterium]